MMDFDFVFDHIDSRNIRKGDVRLLCSQHFQIGTTKDFVFLLFLTDFERKLNECITSKNRQRHFETHDENGVEHIGFLSFDVDTVLQLQKASIRLLPQKNIHHMVVQIGIVW